MERNDLIEKIKLNYQTVQAMKIKNPQAFAASIRSSLEFAVKLFWKEKIGRIPVWITPKGNEEFNLKEAITDYRFSRHFDNFTIAYMHLIRKECNDIIHGAKDLIFSTAKELMVNLEKCIRAMEKLLDFSIITISKNENTQQSSAFAQPIRQRVKHAQFGEGEVVSIENGIIKVVFGGMHIKKFSYPSSMNDGTLVSLNKNCEKAGVDYRKIGTTIEAKTHAEFLNKVLGKDYKGFQKSAIKLPDGKLLWMIELGEFVSPSGWINQLVSSNLVTETHVREEFEFGHNTYKNACLTGRNFDDADRVIFDIIKNGEKRKYVYRGVFRLNKTKSSLKENVWDLIMDEYNQIEISSVDNSNVQTKKTDRNIFFCFQREQYQSESEGEYIFALDGKGIPSWELLKEVKKGDIIFHCAEQAIFAISIAQGEYFYTVRPWVHYSANDYLDLKGNKVKTKYQKLHTPIITCRYMDEIKILQGDSEGMGYPFNKNGTGNQGYLFNLKKSLAKFFMEKIVEKNPFMKEKDYVKELLQ